MHSLFDIQSYLKARAEIESQEGTDPDQFVDDGAETGAQIMNTHRGIACCEKLICSTMVINRVNSILGKYLPCTPLPGVVWVR